MYQMKQQILKSLLLCFVCGYAYGQSEPSSSTCAEGNDSFRCQQGRQVRAILIDLNQSVKGSIDTFTSDPGTVFESGCLDDIASINLSIFRVDPASIWTELYNQIKDEIINRTCSVIEDKINEHRNRLNLALEAPFGLGSVSISNGTDIESSQDIFRVKQTLSNQQIRNEVIQSVFGSPPTAPVRDFSENQIQLPNIQEGDKSSQQKRTKEQESITKFIDLNKLWGKKTDENNSSNQGQQ
jgi:hypothetical protein